YLYLIIDRNADTRMQKSKVEMDKILSSW
ncbi:hypothetical protein EZS27_039888, partial [termite gut metagenome]